MSELIKRVSGRIKKLRTQMGLTQEQAAELCSISYKRFQDIESGRSEDVRLSTLESIARGFRMEAYRLIAAYTEPQDYEGMVLAGARGDSRPGLPDKKVLEAMEREDLAIFPFSHEALGGQGYEAHLDKRLAVREDEASGQGMFKHIEIPQSGYSLEPGKVYLGSTVEHIRAKGLDTRFMEIPFLRHLGIQTVAFAHEGLVQTGQRWTVEITVSMPNHITSGMRIGVFSFLER